MKKLVLVLAIALIAVPAFAAVTLTGTPSGTTVTVGYDATGSVLPRAFGLVLEATGGTITSVTATKVGESNSVAPGYGIFPGTIVIDSCGVVTDYNTPVEPTDLPGGPSALGTSRVVVALGSLYVGDGNKPGATGTLFTVVCSAGTTSLTVSEEETFRGGIVDVNAIGLDIASAPKVYTFACSPQPVVASAVAPTDSATDVAITTDLEWSAAGGTGAKYDVYFGTDNPPATKVGDNQTAVTFDTGTMVNGTTYYWKIVSKNDCDLVGVTSSIFSFTTVALPETISTPTVAKTTAGTAIAGRVNAVRSESFTASGATSSYGHTLEYQFNWGDGSALTWGAATQTHTFTTATTKTWTTNVTVQARCVAHPTVMSSVSAPIAETGETVKSTASFYATWASFSRPNCWGFQRSCRGDADGLGTGIGANKAWVDSTDLNILAAGFNKNVAALKLASYNGVPGICADNDRAGSGIGANKAWVDSTDLTTLSLYYNKNVAATPVCDSTWQSNYNYWTN